MPNNQEEDDYGLTLADAKRLAGMLKWYESHPTNRAALGSQSRPSIVLRNGFTTSLITARVGFVKGTGTCDIYVDDLQDTDNQVVLQSGVSIKNTYGTSVPTGTWVVLGNVDGKLQIFGSDC